MTIVGADSALRGRVLFVVGARRSGTNWLQRVLTAHPAATGMPTETYLFSHGISELAERVQHETPGLPETGVSFMSREAFLAASREFVDRVLQEHLRTNGGDATYVVERTPWHVYHLERIAEVYPEAPIVHVVRDGRDVTRSLLAKEWGPATMEVAAHEWRSSVMAGRTAGAGLANYVEISYERLLADPAHGIPRLFDQVGLELAAGLVDRVTAEARAEYNVDPSFPLIGTGKWRTALSPSDLRIFDRVAGSLLEELGYRREPPPAPHPRDRLAAVGRRVRARGRASVPPREAAMPRPDRAVVPRNPNPLERNANVVRRLQEDLSRGSYAVLDELLGPNAVAQVVDEDEARSGRGSEGTALLRSALEAHRSAGLEPLSGEVLPSVDMFTIVGTYRLGDGSVWSRTLVVTLRAERVIGLALFRHRLAGTTGPPRGTRARLHVAE